MLSEGKFKAIWKMTQNIKLQTNVSKIPTALAQVKADNTSENLLKEIRQIIYSLYRAKEQYTTI